VAVLVLVRSHKLTGIDHLNQAVDQVRRAESTRLRTKSRKAAQRLKHMRWPLLRRGSRVRGRVRQKLNALLASKLATARAWELKEIFSHFWKYKSVIWAGGFLDYWCSRAMRSRLEPMKKVARMLRAHEPLILNWFRAKGEISNGAVAIGQIIAAGHRAADLAGQLLAYTGHGWLVRKPLDRSAEIQGLTECLRAMAPGQAGGRRCWIDAALHRRPDNLDSAPW
jgi:hypothetical protein